MERSDLAHSDVGVEHQLNTHIHGRDRKNENERQFFRDPFFSDQAAALCRTSLETIPVQNPGERDSGLIVYRVVLRRLRGSIQIPSYDLEWARV